MGKITHTTVKVEDVITVEVMDDYAVRVSVSAELGYADLTPEEAEAVAEDLLRTAAEAINTKKADEPRDSHAFDQDPFVWVRSRSDELGIFDRLRDRIAWQGDPKPGPAEKAARLRAVERTPYFWQPADARGPFEVEL